MNLAAKKAKALIEMFRPLVDPRVDGGHGYVFSYDEQTKNAKKCAAFLVDSHIYSENNSPFSTMKDWIENEKLWNEVKTKIEKIK